MIATSLYSQQATRYRKLLTGALVLFAIVILTAKSSCAQQSVVERMRDATTFIASDFGTGSGFLIQRWPQGGLIATNAHVLMSDTIEGAPNRIEVVFHSGLPNEKSLEGKLMAIDPIEDIAVIQVRDADLPSPIELELKSPAKATQKVYVVGFPFGGKFSTKRGANPVLTINSGIVSAVSSKHLSIADRIQIDASVNPGNSGGPLFTEQGKALGIITAKIENTSIGFVQTIDKLKTCLQGACVCAGASKLANTDRVVFRGLLSDPYGQVQSAELRVLDFRSAKMNKTEWRKQSSWPVLQSSNVFPLIRQNVFWRTKESFDPEGVLGDEQSKEAKKLVVQVVCFRRDGTQHNSAPMTVSHLSLGGSPEEEVLVDPWGTPSKRIHWPSFKSALTGPSDWEDVIVTSGEEKGLDAAPVVQRQVSRVSIASAPYSIQGTLIQKISLEDPAVPSQLSWSEDGKYLFWLNTQGAICRISYPSGEDFRIVSSANSYKFFGICRSGLVVSSPQKKTLTLLSMETLQELKKVVDVPEHDALFASSNSDSIFIRVANDPIQLKQVTISKKQVYEEWIGNSKGVQSIINSPHSKTWILAEPTSLQLFELQNQEGTKNSTKRLKWNIGLEESRLFLSPNGRTACAVFKAPQSEVHQIQLFDLTGGDEPILTTQLESSGIQTMAIDSSGRNMLIGTSDRRFHKYNSETNSWGELRLPNGKQSVMGMTYHPNKNIIAVATNQGIYWLN